MVTAEQLSDADTPPVISGTLPVPVTTDWFGAQALITGGVTSLTVKVLVQVDVLPTASLTVIVTVVTPVPTVVPAAGLCVIVTDEQLSLATTPLVKSGTVDWQLPFALAVWFDPHEVIVGAVTSLTVKVLVQVELLPTASVTVIVTVVTPVPTVVPAAGLCVIISEPLAVQLSLATTPLAKFGTVAWQLPFALALWFDPHEVIVGGVTSLTVKVAVQVDWSRAGACPPPTYC